MAKKYKYHKSFTYNGKRHYVYADTLEEVGRKKAEKLAEVKDGFVAASNITVHNYAMKCIELYKTGQSDVTRKKYLDRMNHCIFEHIGDYRVQDITPEICQQIMNIQTGNSRTQVNDVFHGLKFIFSHALYDGLIAKDPTMMLIRPKSTHNTRRALNEVERAAFLKCAVEDRRYYGFLLMYYCGCRPQEAFECMGSDIILGSNVNMLHIRGTKTAQADRLVPIPSALYPLISNIAPSDRISMRQNGNPITYDNRHHVWHGLWYKMNISAGAETYRNQIITPIISKDLTPYCLRHDYCTRLAKAGVDIRTAQKLMGHATITMTANVYTHVDQDDLELAAKLIDLTPSVTP